MKFLLIFILVGLTAAGCSPALHTGENKNNGSANGASSEKLAPSSAATEATAVPSSQGNGSSSSSLPLAITVRPPVIPIGPGQGTPGIPGSASLPLSPAGWLTFTSTALGVAIDYPADWTVTEGSDGATFMSTDGLKILLQAGEAPGNSEDLDCTALTNVSGLTVKLCVDPASGRYSAAFSLNSADGSARELTLSTTDKGALDVYKVMINSLRPAQ